MRGKHGLDPAQLLVVVHVQPRVGAGLRQPVLGATGMQPRGEVVGLQPLPALQRLAARRVGGTRVALQQQDVGQHVARSEEHTSELQSLMRISYAVFCLKKKNKKTAKEFNHNMSQKRS